MAKRDVTYEELYRDPRIRSVTEDASRYGVAASLVDYGSNSDLADGGFYIVAGLGEFPDLSAKGHSPKDLEKQWLRKQL